MRRCRRSECGGASSSRCPDRRAGPSPSGSRCGRPSALASWRSAKLATQDRAARGRRPGASGTGRRRRERPGRRGVAGRAEQRRAGRRSSSCGRIEIRLVEEERRVARLGGGRLLPPHDREDRARLRRPAFRPGVEVGRRPVRHEHLRVVGPRDARRSAAASSSSRCRRAARRRGSGRTPRRPRSRAEQRRGLVVVRELEAVLVRVRDRVRQDRHRDRAVLGARGPLDERLLRRDSAVRDAEIHGACPRARRAACRRASAATSPRRPTPRRGSARAPRQRGAGREPVAPHHALRLIMPIRLIWCR